MTSDPFLQHPTSLRIVTESGAVETTISPDSVAGHEDIAVEFSAATGRLRLTARTSQVKRLVLRWPVGHRDDIPRSFYLADHWERSYGDLDSKSPPPVAPAPAPRPGENFSSICPAVPHGPSLLTRPNKPARFASDDLSATVTHEPLISPRHPRRPRPQP